MFVIVKGVFNHSLLHRLTNEYLTHCNEIERSEMIQSLRQAVVQVLHTRDGARVGMTCIWYGTQKDRKVNPILNLFLFAMAHPYLNCVGYH